MMNPILYFRAARIVWGVHRKTRHLPPHERQRVIFEFQKALYERQTAREDTR
jgi:hypothetical protein